MSGLVTAFREGGMFMYLLTAVAMLATLAAVIAFGAAFASKQRQPALGIGVSALVLGIAVPLVGVIGYALAMRNAYAAVAYADPATRATILAQGISEAMNLIAFGAVCGLVPCAIGFVAVLRAALRPKSP